jgi:hypothetical protein
MTSYLPTIMAAGAGVMMLLAVLAMTVEQYMAAGLSFLCASLVLYFRERALRSA